MTTIRTRQDQGVAATIEVLLVAMSIGGSACGEVPLAHEGRTRYQIVAPADPTAVDDYAARELALYLEQITGAVFPVVAPDTMQEAAPALFIGLSGPALLHLGPDPLGSLDDQEHVARSIGENVFLYGKGVHGNLHAVMEFLEHSLGWRWYSVFEPPVIPRKPTVHLQSFDRRKGFSFPFRQVDLQRGLDYFYQQRINMGFNQRVRSLERRHGPSDLSPFVSAMRHGHLAGVHTLHQYIPPSPESRIGPEYEWVEKRDYFATNPEFFSMLPSGNRTAGLQLCFSNPKLREQLTKTVIEHIGRQGDDAFITLGANDSPGPFCECPACKQLAEQYGGPGGPYYDYVLELAEQLERHHPRAMLKAVAYRKEQTQKPPLLPTGRKFPDNVIIEFAPINDCYFADWTHEDPSIQQTYGDLQAWSKITSHLWAWLYPNPWGTGIVMPVGNVERLINNMRLMHRAGVTGVFTDHCGYHARGGLSELQSYLLYKLMQDVDCDTDAVTVEFTDNFYGPAAPLLRQYLAELEQGRKAMIDLPPDIGYTSPNYDERTFPYLTVENLHRWQTAFDHMEQIVAGQPERVLLNLQLVRRELDFATLWRWFDLQKAYPAYFDDYKVYEERIAAVNRAKAPPPPAWEKKNLNRQPHALGADTLPDFVTLIKAGGQSKPLPAELAQIDASRVRQFVPRYSHHRRGRATILDPQAAFGYAVPVTMPDLPFNFGFYQRDTKTHGARRALAAGEIIPGKYGLYELGPVTITPDCIVWFSARSWETNLQLGERLFEPGAENAWTVYVSLKFEGPSYGHRVDEALVAPLDRTPYGGLAESDLVLVDRIILVKKTTP